MNVAIPDDVRTTGFRAAHDRERLVLSGVDVSTGERIDVSFAMPADRQLGLRVGVDDYVLTNLETTRVRLAGMPPEFSITMITGSFSGGALVITVDCAREPPMLSMAARFVEADPRSWALQIDHDIQHQLLVFIGSASHRRSRSGGRG